FSSGVNNAMQLKTPLPPEFAPLLPGVDLAKRIRVLGEPTGGAPAGYGEVLPFTLPSSKLSGQYSTRFFDKPEFIPEGPAFVPDVPVQMRSNDYFARHDPVLAAVIAQSGTGFNGDVNPRLSVADPADPAQPAQAFLLDGSPNTRSNRVAKGGTIRI